MRSRALRDVSLLAILAAGSAATPALAQVGSPGSAQCPIVAGTVTCTGDISDGFRSDNHPDMRVLNFTALTQTIAPPADGPVVDIRTGNNLAVTFDPTVTVNATRPLSAFSFATGNFVGNSEIVEQPRAAVALLFNPANQSTASFTNAGTIEAALGQQNFTTYHGGAVLIMDAANAAVRNTGAIRLTQTGNSGIIQQTNGIRVGRADTVDVVNDGTISVIGNRTFGVDLRGRDVSFTNNDELSGDGASYRPFSLVARSGAQAASIDFVNAGVISHGDDPQFHVINGVTPYQQGLLVLLGSGTVNFTNSGTIEDLGTRIVTYGTAVGQSQTVTIQNSGRITGDVSIALGTNFDTDFDQQGTYDSYKSVPRVAVETIDLSFTNSGQLVGAGIDLTALANHVEIELTNTGELLDTGVNAAGSSVAATGLAPIAGSSDVRIVNEGDLEVHSEFQIDFIAATSSHSLSIVNRGDIDGSDITDFAAGIRVQQGTNLGRSVFDAMATIENSGAITLAGRGEGIFGLFTEAVRADLDVANSGAINLTSTGIEAGLSLFGLDIDGFSDSVLNNSAPVTVNAVEANAQASAGILFVERSLTDAEAASQATAGLLRGYDHAADLASRVTIETSANITANGNEGFGIFGFLGLTYVGRDGSFEAAINTYTFENSNAVADIDVPQGVSITGGTGGGSAIAARGTGSVTIDNRGTLLGRGGADSGGIVLGDILARTILGGNVPTRPADRFLNLVDSANTGTIRSDGGYGIWAQNGGIVNLVNSGLILGGQGSLRAARASSVVNQASGILDGRIALEGAGSTLANNGIIRISSGPAATHVVNGDFSQAVGGSLTLRGGDLMNVAGNFALNGDLNLALGAPSINPVITVGGNLTLDGRLTVTDAGGFGDGVYRLFNYGGALTDNGLALSALPGGANGTIQTGIANQINLVVGGAGPGPGPGPAPNIQFWDGTDTVPDGAIDGGTAAWNNGATNWTRAAGEVNDPWVGEFAVFQATPGTVTIDSGGVSASGLQFAVGGYRVEGGPLTLSAPATLRVGDGSGAGSGMSATIASAIGGSGGLDKTDLGTLVLTGANSYSGGTRVSGGVLQVSADAALGATSGGVTLDGGALRAGGAFSSARSFTIGAGGGTLDVGGNAVTLSGAIGGAGALTKAGAGTLVLSGSSAGYTGTTNVAAGTLSLSGTLGGTTTIGAGAALRGTGTLGGLVLAGTLAPGNSIGTLSVTGNATFNAGSFYDLELAAAGGTDLLSVAGTAAIQGGTVRVAALDPETQYVDGRSYTFLTAAGGRSGTFAGLSESSAFLDFALGYTATSAFVTVFVLRSFPDVALTFNQRQASTSLAAFAQTPGSDSLSVYNQLLLLDGDAARAAFDASSGEIYPVLVASELRRGAGLASRFLARAQAASGEGWGLWGGASGHDGRTDGDGNGARYTHDGIGGELGIDYRGPNDQWAVGFGIGYDDGDADLKERASRGEADGWHVGGYARYGSGGAGFTATLGGAYASGNAEVIRDIAFGTLNRTATAKVDLDSWALGAEARYGFALGGGWSVGPSARIVHAEADLGAFAETGAMSLNLSGGSSNDEDRTRYGGGLFARWEGAQGSLDASASWLHGGGAPTELGLAMAGAPATPYRVRSARGDGDAAAITLAGALELGGGWSLGVNAEAAFGSRERNLQGNATLGWRF